MRAAWRARFPQIMAGLLLGAIVVWLWNGWQVGLTAVLAGLIIGVVAAPSRQRCARCEAGEPHKVWVDDRTYEIHPGGKDSPERIAALDAHLRRMQGGEN